MVNYLIYSSNSVLDKPNSKLRVPSLWISDAREKSNYNYI